MIFALRTLCYELKKYILDSVGGLPLSVLEKPSNWESGDQQFVQIGLHKLKGLAQSRKGIIITF